MPKGIYPGNKGKKLSRETIEKIRRASIGRTTVQRVKKVCPTCKITMELLPCRTEKQFCSRKCSHKGKKIGWYDKSGDKNPNWRGENVGKSGIHLWIKKQYKRPTRCEFCGKKGELKNGVWTIQWANKKPYKYRRNREDWLWLCAKCHFWYDLSIHKKNKFYANLGK